jgi:hypothetical protein
MSGAVVQIRPKIGFAYEQLTVTAGVQVLTPSKYAVTAGNPGYEAAASAFLTLNGGDIRYTYDGTTPTSSTGHVLRDGGTLTLVGQNQMGTFKCIQTGSTSSEISVTYERE